MARINGSRGQVKMDPTGGTAVATVGDLSKWTLDMKKDRQVVTAFGDTNVQRVMGLPDFSGAISGFWNKLTSPTLFDAILGSIPVFLHLIPDTNDPTYLFKGLANLDGSIDVDVNGAVSFAGSWDAAGNWVMEP